MTPRICIVGSYANKWYGLQLDLHEGILPYKTTTMFPVNILLSRKTQYNNISVANDDDADLIAFLKEILNNGKCKESYFIKARIAWIKNKVFYSDILLEIYGENFIKLLSDIFESDFNKVNITRLANYGQTILTNNVSVKIANIKSMLSRYYRFLKPPGYYMMHSLTV